MLSFDDEDQDEEIVVKKSSKFGKKRTFQDAKLEEKDQETSNKIQKKDNEVLVQKFVKEFMEKQETLKQTEF